MKLLLDTGAYAALMRGDPLIAERVRRAERILLPAVVVGELAFAFRCGGRARERAAALEQFLENPHVELVPVTAVTADRFARIAASLRAKGAAIPTNDIWIAATAMETGAELLSFNAHFASVEGLAWDDPAG